MRNKWATVFLICVSAAAAQAPVSLSATSPDAAQAPPANGRTFGERRDGAKTAAGTYTVDSGTQILLTVVSSVSSSQARVGDRVYLKTAFPVFSGGKIVIPEGSYVTATVSSVKRAATMRRGGELQMRFDSLVLPNGVYRNFNGDLSSIDDRGDQALNRENGEVSGKSSKGSKAATVAIPAVTGTAIGSTIGAATGHVGAGIGAGAGAGAALGTALVLFGHGPNARLEPGSSIQMMLTRPLSFATDELSFQGTPVSPSSAPSTGGQHGIPHASGHGWSRLPL